jgi:aryl-alcohol dehydrogenase-like predicted oxidoreductase
MDSMERIQLPKTDLTVARLCLGGNVFGWSADEAQSHAVLNAYQELGGNFVDTADMYSEWAPGHIGGESEVVIGNWMRERKNRDNVIVATKVAKLSIRPGLSRANIIAACDDSLRRLQTDHIDLYYAHEDDQTVELAETLGAFDELKRAGKIRFAAASNYTGARLREAAAVSRELGLTEYVAVQNHYNLIEREEYETDARPAVQELGLSGIPFFGLARGFLSGKYRPGVEIDSVRASGVTQYLNARGWGAIERLQRIANHQSTDGRKVHVSAVALAWLRQQPTIAAPIASARTVDQLHQFAVELTLSAEELAFLTE